jgi:Amt family ammonium transporter
MKETNVKTLLTTIVFILVIGPGFPAFAESADSEQSVIESIDIGELKQGLDTVWVLIAAFLVFFMQAGFGMVEAGFIRAKNACNILTKNFLDFCMASLGFFLIGYGLMFGDGNAFMGLKGWCLLGLPGCILRSGSDYSSRWNG